MKTLVLDAGALISGVDLSALGDNYVTTDRVLAEVKDEQSRDFLKFTSLLREVETREFEEKDMETAKKLARLTGDLGALSQEDLGVIALAIGVLRSQGVKIQKAAPLKMSEMAVEADDFASFQWNAPDDGGWISKKNVELKEDPWTERVIGDGETDELKKEEADEAVEPVEAEEIPDSMAVVTGDFAVQNVCISFQIPVLAANGKLIKETRTWAAICYTCWELARNTSLIYCPECGNTTMRRVPVKYEANGKATLLRDSLPKVSTKATIFPINPPKGGRNNRDPLVSQDMFESSYRIRQLKSNVRKIQKYNQEDAWEFGCRGGAGIGQKQTVYDSSQHGMNPRRLAVYVGKKPQPFRKRK